MEIVVVVILVVSGESRSKSGDSLSKSGDSSGGDSRSEGGDSCSKSGDCRGAGAGENLLSWLHPFPLAVIPEGYPTFFSPYS